MSSRICDGAPAGMSDVSRSRLYTGVVGTADFVSCVTDAMEGDDGMVLVAHAESIAELMRRAEALDVVLVRVPVEESPADAVRGSRAASGTAHLIVVVPPEAGPSHVRRVLRAGADGVLDELELARTLAAAVAVIQAGSVCVPRRLASGFTDAVLSIREKEILGLAIRGASNHEIAQQLCVAETTIKSHLSSAYAKLGVRTRQEAAAMVLDPAEGLGPGIVEITSSRDDSVTVDPPPDLSAGAGGDESRIIVRVPEHVVYRTLADETVLLDLRTGTYYGLNETAGTMLTALERHPDLDSAVAQLAGVLEAQPDRLRSDLRALVTGLAAEGLLELETITGQPGGDR